VGVGGAGTEARDDQGGGVDFSGRSFDRPVERCVDARAAGFELEQAGDLDGGIGDAAADATFEVAAAIPGQQPGVDVCTRLGGCDVGRARALEECDRNARRDQGLVGAVAQEAPPEVGVALECAPRRGSPGA
jgi:hypothetical protein